LLQKRKGGWADNMWEASACGHIDHGEGPIDASIHEALEEIGVIIEKKDARFIHIVFKEVGGCDHAYYNFSFICTKWKNEPSVGEPDKCYEIKWFDINKLPKNIINDRKIALKEIDKNFYSEIFPKK
jgi:isopentenyldiphosphate isomerase